MGFDLAKRKGLAAADLDDLHLQIFFQVVEVIGWLFVDAIAH